jgi:hypothetical protein
MSCTTVALAFQPPNPPRDMRSPGSSLLPGLCFWGSCRPFRDEVARNPTPGANFDAVPLSRTLWEGDVGQTAIVPVEAMSPSGDRSRTVSPCPPSGRLYGPLCEFLGRKSRSPQLRLPTPIPEGSQWLGLGPENKHDGYRLIAHGMAIGSGSTPAEATTAAASILGLSSPSGVAQRLFFLHRRQH